MIRLIKNAAAAIALTGLVLAQPAMAVRSSESLPAPGAKVTGVAARVGSPVGATDKLTGIPTFGWLLAALVAVGVIVIINNDNADSPG